MFIPVLFHVKLVSKWLITNIAGMNVGFNFFQVIFPRRCFNCDPFGALVSLHMSVHVVCFSTNITLGSAAENIVSKKFSRTFSIFWTFWGRVFGGTSVPRTTWGSASFSVAGGSVARGLTEGLSESVHYHQCFHVYWQYDVSIVFQNCFESTLWTSIFIMFVCKVYL